MAVEENHLTTVETLVECIKKADIDINGDAFKDVLGVSNSETLINQTLDEKLILQHFFFDCVFRHALTSKILNCPGVSLSE